MGNGTRGRETDTGKRPKGVNECNAHLRIGKRALGTGEWGNEEGGKTGMGNQGIRNGKQGMGDGDR